MWRIAKNDEEYLKQFCQSPTTKYIGYIEPQHGQTMIELSTLNTIEIIRYINWIICSLGVIVLSAQIGLLWLYPMIMGGILFIVSILSLISCIQERFDPSLKSGHTARNIHCPFWALFFFPG